MWSHQLYLDDCEQAPHFILPMFFLLFLF
ncbi:hypothetical protein CGRA01v4_05834 [Colletotrichum graminicola]|nr:hypothetical protein CGRA01v4_05834 [Colletotrichum graminicola]